MIMKKKNVAAVLAILLGTFGVHKFYLGDKGIGIIYLLLCWTGIPTLAGVIDGVLLLIKSNDSFDAKYNNISMNNDKEKTDALYFLDGVSTRLYVYNNKVIIEHHGILGVATQGLSGKKTIPMKSIHSLQFREGGSAVNGFLQFGIAGGVERQGGVFVAAGDENSVIFSKDKNAEAYEIKEFIESKIYSSDANATIINQVSGADEILKLKGLLDQGIITETEFEQKKAKLLR